jgi:putative polyhydroxyalkanoate system protein
MATIDIRRTHALGLEKAREAAEAVAKRLQDKVEAKWRWVGDEIVFERTGAKGRIAVTPSSVHVEIDLSFVLRPLKGKLEQKANQYLDEYVK